MDNFHVAGHIAHGARELKSALQLRDTWWYCGLQDIRLRYRRSVLGPWWLTLSTAITIAALGLVWSRLFQSDMAQYLPFFATGHVLWIWMSSQMNDACTGFTQFEHIIKQTRLPYPSYLLRLHARHGLILAHNAVIMLIVLAFYGSMFNAVSWLALAGLALVAVICLFISIVLAISCTRYRDLTPIVANVLQVSFFLTPILWQPSSLKTATWMANLNPMYHWIEIIRQPLLGRVPYTVHYIWTACSLCGLGLLALWTLGRARDRISYWL